MAQDETLTEIRSLIAEADRVAVRVREVERGARFQRSDERANRLAERIRKARSLLDLVITSLDGSDDANPVVAPTDEDPWLRGKIKTLSSLLAGGATSAPLEGAWKAQPPESSGPLRPSLRGRPSLKGRLGTTTISDLLGFLQVSAKSGELTIEHADESVKLEFEGGKLVSANSDSKPPGTRLGEILVSQGAIDDARLQSVLFCNSTTKTLLGEALRRGDLIDEDQLRAALEEQLIGIFKRLREREDAKFTFYEGPTAGGADRAYWNVAELLTSAGGQSAPPRSPADGE